MKKPYFKCLSLIILVFYWNGCGIATVSVYDIGAHVNCGYNKVLMVDGESTSKDPNDVVNATFTEVQSV